MRSSKSRSRSKSNRPRSIGNIINRVFDSSGPEGKVRGTPQQIIEKYQFLARDAQLSNDRVAAENFMQHAEHYTRMLAEAQRELAAEQDQRRSHEYAQGAAQTHGYPAGQAGQSAHQGGQGNPGSAGQGGHQHGSAQNRDRAYGNDRPDPRDEPQPDVGPARSASMMDFIEGISDSGLVETPETRRTEQGAVQRTDHADRRDRGSPGDRTMPPQERRQDRRDDRRPRGERPQRPPKAQQDEPAIQDAGIAAQRPALQAEGALAPDAPPAAPKRARVPRKPRSDASDGGSSGPAEAAE